MPPVAFVQRRISRVSSCSMIRPPAPSTGPATGAITRRLRAAGAWSTEACERTAPSTYSPWPTGEGGNRPGRLEEAATRSARGKRPPDNICRRSVGTPTAEIRTRSSWASPNTLRAVRRIHPGIGFGTRTGGSSHRTSRPTPVATHDATHAPDDVPSASTSCRGTPAAIRAWAIPSP